MSAPVYSSRNAIPLRIAAIANRMRDELADIAVVRRIHAESRAWWASFDVVSSAIPAPADYAVTELVRTTIAQVVLEAERALCQPTEVRAPPRQGRRPWRALAKLVEVDEAASAASFRPTN